MGWANPPDSIDNGAPLDAARALSKTALGSVVGNGAPVSAGREYAPVPWGQWLWW